MELDPTNTFDRERALDHVVLSLTEARQEGLETLVDLTVIGVSHDVELMQEASTLSGVAIVACTGWWIAAGITTWPLRRC